MRFSPDFIEKVREANNIVEIIGQHTELKPSGHRLMGRCPFPDHKDKSPSFSVTEDNQLYHCYGCKKGGNLYTFLQTYNGMSFPEAVEHLARRASIPLPEPEKGAAAPQRAGLSRDQKDLLLRVNKTAAIYYHRELMGLPEDHPVRAYCVKRGLTPTIIEKFRLGFATEQWQGLLDHLREKKIPLEFAERLGLIKPKKKANDGFFDLFRERLMFPIFGPTSDVIGFGGRTLGDGIPKYLNSSDSPVFNKSRVLYGVHETGRFIRAADTAVIVEGYMDALALYSAGIENVAAILGTAFTPEHAKLLKRYTLNVTMLLDGDEAGISAAERSLPILLEAGIAPKGVLLPEKMDPDDFVKAHSADRLKAEIERAPDLFSLLLSKRWMANYHGRPSEKTAIMAEAAAVLRVMQNSALRDLYVLEMSRQLDADVTWLRRELQKVSREIGEKITPAKPAIEVEDRKVTQAAPIRESQAQAEDLTEKPPDPRILLKSVPKDEAFVLSLLVQSEPLMNEFLEAGSDVIQIFSHEGIKAALSLAMEIMRAKPENFDSLASTLISRVDRPEVITCAVSLVPDLGTPESADRARRIMGDYMRAIRRKFYKQQARILASSLGQVNPENLEEKLEELQQIHRLLSEDGGEKEA